MVITTPKDYFNNIINPPKMKKKNIIFIVVGIVCIILIGYFLGGKEIALAPSKSLKSDSTNKEKTIITPSAKIIISNQIPGEIILVAKVTMAADGWVAVHDNNNDKPGNILGAYFLPTGIYEDTMIPLLRGVVDEKSYFVIIHKDDGDRVFDYKIDTPEINSAGQMETVGFNVIAESPKGE